MIDYTKPTPPLTLSCKNLAEKITNYINTDNVIKSDFGVSNSEEADPILSSESINQLTINEYLPGQGIAPHIGELQRSDKYIKLLTIYDGRH